jgi:aldose 1-epimerase
MQVEVMYTLDDDTTWWVDYHAAASASSDMDMVVSLTQHTYWNLNGCRDDVLEHVLWMPNTTSFLEIDEYLLPTGSFTSVAHVPAMDFSKPKPVGTDIANATAASASGGGEKV